MTDDATPRLFAFPMTRASSYRKVVDDGVYAVRVPLPPFLRLPFGAADDVVWVRGDFYAIYTLGKTDEVRKVERVLPAVAFTQRYIATPGSNHFTLIPLAAVPIDEVLVRETGGVVAYKDAFGVPRALELPLGSWLGRYADGELTVIPPVTFRLDYRLSTGNPHATIHSRLMILFGRHMEHAEQTTRPSGLVGDHVVVRDGDLIRGSDAGGYWFTIEFPNGKSAHVGSRGSLNPDWIPLIEPFLAENGV